MTTILVSQNNETATWVPKFLQEDLFHFCERGKFKTLKRLHESSKTLLSMPACCWPWYSLFWTLPKYTVKRLILQINRWSHSENQFDPRKQNLLVLACVTSGILVRGVLSLRRSRQAKPATKSRGKIPPATFLMSFECRPLLTPWLEIFHYPVIKSSVIRNWPANEPGQA